MGERVFEIRVTVRETGVCKVRSRITSRKRLQEDGLQTYLPTKSNQYKVGLVGKKSPRHLDRRREDRTK